MKLSGGIPAWPRPRWESPAAAGATLGSGLRCALHALGGQRHRVVVPGDRGSGGPDGFGAQPGVRMTDSRTVAVWERLAANAAGHGHRVSVADVCAVAVSSVGLSGAWAVAARGAGPDFVMCVTDPVGERLAELQLMLGE